MQPKNSTAGLLRLKHFQRKSGGSVYVIGQTNVGCENGVPPYTVVLKFDHQLNSLGNFSYANSQGYGIVADAQYLDLAVSDGSFPSADFGIIILDKDTLALKTKHNSGLPHYNQPWGLDKKGNELLIAGFAIDPKDACFHGNCGNWHVQVWSIKCDGLERIWAQTAHANNQRVDQAHDGVFDREIISDGSIHAFNFYSKIQLWIKGHKRSNH